MSDLYFNGFSVVKGVHYLHVGTPDGELEVPLRNQDRDDIVYMVETGWFDTLDVDEGAADVEA